jgi:hypothetical protein
VWGSRRVAPHSRSGRRARRRVAPRLRRGPGLLVGDLCVGNASAVADEFRLSFRFGTDGSVRGWVMTAAAPCASLDARRSRPGEASPEVWSAGESQGPQLASTGVLFGARCPCVKPRKTAEGHSPPTRQEAPHRAAHAGRSSGQFRREAASQPSGTSPTATRRHSATQQLSRERHYHGCLARPWCHRFVPDTTGRARSPSEK